MSITSIWDMSHATQFYNDVVNFERCDDFSTDFFCIAARRKYLDQKAKEHVKFGNTCMMHKTILKEYDVHKFQTKLLQADKIMDYFYDRDYNAIPRNCMVFYMNVNHTDVLKAMNDFETQLTSWHYDISSLMRFKNGNKVSNIAKQIKSVQNSLLKSFQDPANKVFRWIDIDCDLIKPFDPQTIKDHLTEICGFWVPVIVTQGGVHCLVNAMSLTKYNSEIAASHDKREVKDLVLNPPKIVNMLKEFLDSKFIIYKECTFNQNAAVPIPGTMQNDFPVRMI